MLFLGILGLLVCRPSNVKPLVVQLLFLLFQRCKLWAYADDLKKDLGLVSVV